MPRRSHTTGKTAALVACGAVLAALSTFCRPAQIEPPERSVTDGEGPSTAEPLGDPEDWVAKAMENGTGIVRVRAEGGLHQDHRVVTAGPLSAAGKAALARTLAAAREKLEASLSERRERPASDNPVRDYQVELSLVLKLERARVIESMFRRQAYLTIQNGDAPPPRPPGTSLKHVGPFELAAGGLGWAVFFVDLGKHQETRDYRDALREVMAIDRQESIQRFNGRTDEQRRAWVDRYRELDAKRASQGLAALEGEELREFLAMDKELRYLRARIHYESATLSPL